MDWLRGRIQVSESNAVVGFRRIHVAAILINLAQLITIVSSLIAVSLQMR
jgi:hypothetical protein